MIMPYPEYFGKEVNTYDGMGRMTSFEWYDFDFAKIASPTVSVRFVGELVTIRGHK